MNTLGKLAEGTTVKVWENGKAVDFVVAKHNYLSGLNGTGHTLLVRAEPLSETRIWADYYQMSAPTDLRWSKHAVLRTWLENDYAKMIRAGERACVKKLTINCEYGYGSVENMAASFFVLAAGDIEGSRYYDDGDQLSEAARTALEPGVAEKVCWTRSTKKDDYTSGDGEERDYGEAAVFLAKGAVVHKLELKGWEYTLNEKHYVLPCFAMVDTVVVDSSGALRANHAPEIVSNYFGTESTHTKRSAFGLPYRVSDADKDTVTVTEYLDNAKVRTYTAVDGGTNTFRVTEETLSGLDEAVDHELKVSASDGAAVTVKSYRFRKVIGSGYVVYMGKIAGSSDGTGYYWTERHVLHDPGDETKPVVLDPDVTLEKNDFGSFIFTVPASNPYRSKITLKNTVISVEEDGTEIFMGYVTELNTGFEGDTEVTCEGELGYLQDRDCILEEKAYTTSQLIRLAVTASSDFAKEGKAFNAGTVTVAKPDTDKDEKETKTITDCWSVAKSYLVDKYGGYLRLRKVIKMENDILVYRRYLDYMTDIPDQTDQVIQFGVNLLDLSYYVRSNQIVNAVTVIGYETTGWFIFTDTHQLTVEVVDAASIAKYGRCQRIITVDGTSSTTEFLKQKGLEELKKYTSQFGGSITVNAADLADVGVDVDRLQFMKKTRVISDTHELKSWMLCTKETIPLDAPEEKTFTFGDSVANLSALQAANFGTAGKAWKAVQSTIRYVRNGSGG